MILPMRDCEATIDAQLEALSRQSFSGRWELIVADNGSADASVELAESWDDRISSLQVIDASTATGAYGTRNAASRVARAPLLAFCDADDVVGSRWLEALAHGLARWPLVTGPIDLSLLNSPQLVRWRRENRWERLPAWHRFLPGALTSNLGVRREVFEALNRFTIAPSGSDLRLVWHAQLAGARLGYAPDALVHRREPVSWGRYMRRSFRYGCEEPQLYREFASEGMPRSSLMQAGLRWVGVLLGWPLLAASKWRYAWLDIAAHRTGRLLGSIRARRLYL